MHGQSSGPVSSSCCTVPYRWPCVGVFAAIRVRRSEFYPRYVCSLEIWLLKPPRFVCSCFEVNRAAFAASEAMPSSKKLSSRRENWELSFPLHSEFPGCGGGEVGNKWQGTFVADDIYSERKKGTQRGFSLNFALFPALRSCEDVLWSNNKLFKLCRSLLQADDT